MHAAARLSVAAALALALLPAALLAQTGAIAGRIIDRGADARPGGGIMVVVVGTRLGALTDSLGRFRIGYVPAGLYELEARPTGTEPSRAPIIVRPGETARVDLPLAAGPVEVASVTVIGRRSDALARLPGSAAVVTAQSLVARNPVSANEALRGVPGLHVQEEEGAGLRANIGIRGLDPDRSRAVLVLEDGVPVALAPYGEPEMYYSPPIDRMQRIEVIKGSGSILFGPQTVGGVINYVTAPPPLVPAGRLQLQGGTGGARLLKTGYGGTWGNARGAVLGFMKTADDWNGLSFDVRDATVKAGLATSAGDFGLKLSAYDEQSNATYVGLTDSMFRADPHRHPRPDDRLDVRRYALTSTHEIGVGGAMLRTSAYGYHTTRDWTRRDYTYSESSNGHLFRNTTGSRDRSFEVAGVEPRLSASWSLGGVRSDIDLGLRAHYERARDRHVDGAIGSDVRNVRDDEIRTGRAAAAFLQNRFFLAPTVHVTPGVRLERFEFDRHILRTRIRRHDGATATRNAEDVDLRTADAIVEVIPGIGGAWTPNELVTVFAGAHRGFAPPRAKDALIYPDPTLGPGAQVPDPVSLQLDAERSWNYEVGTRVAPARWMTLEATAFYLDFSNQIIEPSLSAGSVTVAALANQGATRHRGAELGFDLDLGKLLYRPYSLTLGAGYTYSDAAFSRPRLMLAPSGDTADVAGNRLPYAPRSTASAALTFAHPRGILVRLDGVHVGDHFADNFETVAGTANGRIGRIPAYRVYDLGSQLAVPGLRSLRLTGSVKNLTNRNYIASRRPEGIKPGLPRLATLGVVWEF
ncbi:MAG: TonB-dependent receptor [Gemmatimonadota bacterium]|nr:TonB-dependent receptor [Gemmatimonadota bacterium]